MFDVGTQRCHLHMSVCGKFAGLLSVQNASLSHLIQDAFPTHLDVALLHVFDGSLLVALVAARDAVNGHFRIRVFLFSLVLKHQTGNTT